MKDIFLVLDSYQYQMESSYQETSSLTNLFTENKFIAVSYTHLRAHETEADLVCRLLLEKKTINRPSHPINLCSVKRLVREDVS